MDQCRRSVIGREFVGHYAKAEYDYQGDALTKNLNLKNLIKFKSPVIVQAQTIRATHQMIISRNTFNPPPKTLMPIRQNRLCRFISLSESVTEFVRDYPFTVLILYFSQ